MQALKQASSKQSQTLEIELGLWGNDLTVGAKGGAGGYIDLQHVLMLTFPHINFVLDTKYHRLRCLPIYYQELRDFLLTEVLAGRYANLIINFEPAPPLDFEPTLTIAPREYQTQAIAAWQAAQNRGVVVLPTGAGKTFVAAMAIARLKLATLVIVPTIDLLQQWQTALASYFGLKNKEDIGVFGGGRQEIKPLTIITYDSAIIHTRNLNKFGLLVFDEAHHLPAESYRSAAEGAFAPFRLGLSATPERADNLHLLLAHLIGPEVYRRLPSELTRQKFLATYREEKILVELSQEERVEYDNLITIYKKYLNKMRFATGYNKFAGTSSLYQQLIYQSGRNPQAREALLAYQKARQLAFNAEAKLGELEKLLQRHRSDKVIIFSEFNSVVDEVNRRYFVPAITYKTRADERKAILERFRAGEYSKLVSGRVLNEGVDVPDANVAIVVSGNSTAREYIQRLGRVLRPKAGQAVLYELISDETGEIMTARKRKRSSREANS